MNMLTLIVALVIEQLRPVDAGRWVRAPLSRVADRFWPHDDESESSGRARWWVVVTGLVVSTWVAWMVLAWLHPLFAFAFNVFVLYLVMAHRRENHCFSDIVLALSTGDTERARTILGEWDGRDHAGASAGEVARLAIERALVAAHRNLFGPVFWFVILPGPVGAVLYRVAERFAQDWGRGAAPGEGMRAPFGRFAQRAFDAIDWVPVRLTAMAFSVIGNFEDAIYCWRAQSMLWADKASGILIASGAGALGVRLGLPIHESGGVVDRPEMGLGSKADVGYMQAAAKLVWRVLVLVLLLLALLGIASWVGR